MSLSCLPAPTVDPGCLIDVLGTICAISDIKPFKIPNQKDVLIKQHVYLRDLLGHEIKIVLWGNCALHFNEYIIHALGKAKPVVAIFVGATIQEYDGSRGLAGGAACSWYVDADIVDISIFLPRYCLPVIASDQTGEAEFTLFGSAVEQLIGSHIQQVIQHN